ncbi:MAG: hypothetical protein Q9N02_11265 [Ghiorsea sp.]|nr:hypothetical protein [Ghiorsea sp.]
MMGLPLSWTIALAALGAVVSYVVYLKWQRGIAERKAEKAVAQRDNARVKQHVTQAAQEVEHAYQQAHDDIISKPQADKPKSLLERLNNTLPIALLLLMFAGCTPQIKTVYVNPAKEVVIPADAPLEHYAFVQLGDMYCMDTPNSEAFLRNIIKIKARIAGLEAVLRELGATIK